MARSVQKSRFKPKCSLAQRLTNPLGRCPYSGLQSRTASSSSCHWQPLHACWCTAGKGDHSTGDSGGARSTAHPQSRAQGNPGLSGADALLWSVAVARAQCHQGWGVLLGARVGVTPRRRGRGRPPAAAARGKQSTACLPAPSSLTPTTPATHSYACPMTHTELSRGVDGTPAAQLQSEQPAAWRARHEAPTPAEPCLRQF